MDLFLKIIFVLLILFSILIFLASCIVTLSDGQGFFIFFISLPIIATLLSAGTFLGKRIDIKNSSSIRFSLLPKLLAAFIFLFFLFSLIPGLRILPDVFMNVVERSFVAVSGKSPRIFFEERASLPNKLRKEMTQKRKINFSDLELTFAWDKVCIFGPYTNNKKAKSVLNLDWKIEEHSEVHFSDSVNALVFLYQDNVNKAVDLNRGIADFKNLDLCLSRETAHFEVKFDKNGLRYLELITKHKEF